MDQAAKVTMDAWQRDAGAAAADVTLVTGSNGGAVACHGVVLAACSPLFRAILSTADTANPAVIVVTDVTDNIDDVRSLVEFMYAGRLQGCSQDRLDRLVACAKSLGIAGLAEFTRDNSDFTVKEVEVKKSHDICNSSLSDQGKLLSTIYHWETLYGGRERELLFLNNCKNPEK